MRIRAPSTFSERLKPLVDAAGGVSAVSRISGIKRSTLDNYYKGTSEPKVGDAIRLADALVIDPNYLVIGDATSAPGSTPATAANLAEPAQAVPAGIDHELLGLLTEAIRKLYKEEGTWIDDRGFGKLLGEIYDTIVEAGYDPNDRPAMVRLAVINLRKELRSRVGVTAQGNRSA